MPISSEEPCRRRGNDSAKPRDPSEVVSTVSVAIHPGATMLTVIPSGPSSLASAREIPTIAPCASTPTLPGVVGDYMFANYTADNLQGAALADFAVQQGYKTALILLSKDTPYTEKLPLYFAKVFAAEVRKRFFHEIDALRAAAEQMQHGILDALRPLAPGRLGQRQCLGAQPAIDDLLQQTEHQRSCPA